MRLYLNILVMLWANSLFASSADYCFNPGKFDQALKTIKEYKAPKDQLYIDGQNYCFQIRSNPELIELYTQVLQKRFKLRSLRFDRGTSPSTRKCQLVIEEIGQSKNRNNSIQIGRDSRLIGVDTKGISTNRTSLNLLSGKYAQIKINDRDYQLKCHRLPKIARVEIYLSSDKDKLITELEIIPGQKVNVGEMLSNENQSSKRYDSSPQFKSKKRKYNAKKQYFLFLNP